MNTYKEEAKLASGFARLNLNYQDLYIFQLVIETKNRPDLAQILEQETSGLRVLVLILEKY